MRLARNRSAPLRSARPVVLAVLVAAGVMVLTITPTAAVHPEQWRFRIGGDFAAGEFTSITVGDDGALRLAPRLVELYVAPDPYIWSLVRDHDGNLFAGSGNQGRIFRIGPDGDGELFFDTNELEIHALAIGPDGRLYAGSSPMGRVYVFDADGAVDVFFEPGQTYIWDLDFLPDGDLLVATGPEGILYRVDPDGTGTVWFDAEDTHLRSLLVRRDGSVAVGTSGGGLVISLTPDGDPFVLHDSPQEEIVDLAEGPDGSLYAAALAPQQIKRSNLIQPQPQNGKTSTKTKAAVKRASLRVNIIYRIDPEGTPTELWRTTSEDLFRLLWVGDELLVGTGKKGRLLSLTAAGDETERIRVGAAQVTAMAVGDDGDLYLGASNLGFVSRLGVRSAPEGEYLSQVKDTHTVSDWGNFSWKEEVPDGAAVRMQVRTGNTGSPDRTWSDWSKPYTDPDGSRVDRPRARYVQWRASLKPAPNGDSPALREVGLAYLQQNLAPKISSVSILSPGTKYNAAAVSKATDSTTKKKTPTLSTKSSTTSARTPTASVSSPPPRSSTQTGWRSVRWTASDPNGDALTYSVFFRGEGEKLWKPMKEEIAAAFFSWDATAMPDGVYQIRVVATDGRANPRGEALEAEEVSDPFFVDHTPPRVEDLEAAVRAGRAEVTFLATDSFSAIEAAQYSIDAQEWQALYPEDRVADSSRESFRFETDDLKAGEHTIVVRTTDEMGNRGAGKIVLEVPEE